MTFRKISGCQILNSRSTRRALRTAAVRINLANRSFRCATKGTENFPTFLSDCFLSFSIVSFNSLSGAARLSPLCPTGTTRVLVDCSSKFDGDSVFRHSLFQKSRLKVINFAHRDSHRDARRVRPPHDRTPAGAVRPRFGRIELHCRR